MNNNQINLNNTQVNNAPKFDPMTGQPIINDQNKNIIETTNTLEQNTTNNETINVQSQMQAIPTVEQNNEQFINNIQAANNDVNEKENTKKSLIFMIILFVIILVSILFVFPYLSKFI